MFGFLKKLNSKRKENQAMEKDTEKKDGIEEETKETAPPATGEEPEKETEPPAEPEEDKPEEEEDKEPSGDKRTDEGSDGSLADIVRGIVAEEVRAAIKEALGAKADDPGRKVKEAGEDKSRALSAAESIYNN